MTWHFLETVIASIHLNRTPHARSADIQTPFTIHHVVLLNQHEHRLYNFFDPDEELVWKSRPSACVEPVRRTVPGQMALAASSPRSAFMSSR
jgi:hypothetical protein